MRLSTKLKFITTAAMLTFAVSYVISRYGREMRQKLKQAQKRRELQAELARVMGEKVRIEEELRQMEEDQGEQ